MHVNIRNETNNDIIDCFTTDVITTTSTIITYKYH